MLEPTAAMPVATPKLVEKYVVKTTIPDVNTNPMAMPRITP